jgi:hypothetical protein
MVFLAVAMEYFGELRGDKDPIFLGMPKQYSMVTIWMTGSAGSPALSLSNTLAQRPKARHGDYVNTDCSQDDHVDAAPSHRCLEALETKREAIPIGNVARSTRQMDHSAIEPFQRVQHRAIVLC